MQRPIDCREHHARTAQMVDLEVVVRVARSGGTLAAGYRAFGGEHVQQLVVAAVDHHRAVVSQRTVRIAGQLLPRCAINIVNLLIALKEYSKNSA